MIFNCPFKIIGKMQLDKRRKYKIRKEVKRSEFADDMVVYLIKIIENQMKNYNQ